MEKGHYEKHEDPCKFNRGVDCIKTTAQNRVERNGGSACDICGWCPEVEKRRTSAVRKAYGIKTIGEKLEMIYNEFRAGQITKEDAARKFEEARVSIFGV